MNKVESSTISIAILLSENNPYDSCLFSVSRYQVFDTSVNDVRTSVRDLFIPTTKLEKHGYTCTYTYGKRKKSK